MTYEQLCAAVAAMTDRSFNVELSTWRHVHPAPVPTRTETEWSIAVFDSHHSIEHRVHSCATADEALAALRVQLQAAAEERAA